jgi:hypothetical protein
MAGAEAERVILGSCGLGDGDDRRQIEMMAESDDCDFDEVRWGLARAAYARDGPQACHPSPGGD